MRKFLVLWSLVFVCSYGKAAADNVIEAGELEVAESADAEINPFDPNIEKALREFDEMYEQETGERPFLPATFSLFASGCYRQECPVYAYVSLSQQRMYLYVNGQQVGEYLVSTGARGSETPFLDRRPNGRIYDKYTSTKFPEGDYKGLGNMPFAVFIAGGIAIHGTTKGNFKRLGTRASHGCIRLHPDNAIVFNRLVRKYGIAQSWVTIQ